MLEEAESRLASARKDGDPLMIGEAHLDIALAYFRRASDWSEFLTDAQQAISQTDLAIETFTSIPFPGGIAQGHLARASIFTQLAEGEKDALKKAENVDRALTACGAAQGALDTENVHTSQAFDIYSSVGAILLQLRGMIDEKEFQAHIDELIRANSTVLGEIAAEDVQLRDEGSAILMTAQLLGALGELEEDKQEREALLKTQSVLAHQAILWLESTSDLDLISSAQDVSQQAIRKLESKDTSAKTVQEVPQGCPQCGYPNTPGANFCNDCGASLN